MFSSGYFVKVRTDHDVSEEIARKVSQHDDFCRLFRGLTSLCFTSVFTGCVCVCGFLS